MQPPGRTYKWKCSHSLTYESLCVSTGLLVVQLLHSVPSFFLLGTEHKWKGKEIGFVDNKTLYQTPLWLYCNRRNCGNGSKNWCQKTGTTVKYVTPHDTNDLPFDF